MKIKTTPGPQAFEPVTITVTIETLEELVCLYGNMNQSVSSIRNSLDSIRCDHAVRGYETSDLFDALSLLATERGLK